MKVIIGVVFLWLTQATYGDLIGNILSVSRPLQLSAKDPRPPKEYLIDLGENDGVKIGYAFSVFRILSVREPRTGGDFIKVLLGELTVGRVGIYTSHARMAQISDSPQNYGEPFVMIGDVIERKTHLPVR